MNQKLTYFSLIGEKIKSLREIRSISLEELSAKSAISLEYINEIENHRVNPSIGELIKIARALGVRVGTLLDDNPNNGVVISRGGENNPSVREIKTGSGISSYSALSKDKLDRNLETYIITLLPKTDEAKYSSHEGEEFLYVISGSVEIEYGKEIYNLNAGDTIHYDSIVSHAIYASNPTGAKILAVIYIPS